MVAGPGSSVGRSQRRGPTRSSSGPCARRTRWWDETQPEIPCSKRSQPRPTIGALCAWPFSRPIFSARLLSGRQQTGLTLARLTEGRLPLLWTEQALVLDGAMPGRTASDLAACLGATSPCSAQTSACSCASPPDMRINTPVPSNNRKVDNHMRNALFLRIRSASSRRDHARRPANAAKMQKNPCYRENQPRIGRPETAAVGSALSRPDRRANEGWRAGTRSK